MNNDIKNFPVYFLNNGKLVEIFLNSTKDYDHYICHLHHYIKKQDYDRNKEWFEERGIKQKLILLPIPCHEQVHFQAVKNLSDAEFENKYKISRWKLIFSRKHSEY